MEVQKLDTEVAVRVRQITVKQVPIAVSHQHKAVRMKQQINLMARAVMMEMDLPVVMNVPRVSVAV